MAVGGNAEGGLVYGPYALGNIPDSYRLYDMDRLSKLIVITRGTTKFLHYLQHQEGLKKSRRVETFEPRVQDIQELSYQFSPAQNSANATTIIVANQFGRSTVKPNDLLVVSSLYYHPEYGANAAYSNQFGVQNGLGYLRNELLFVTAVGNNDSAGAGLTTITVRRGWASNYQYPSYAPVGVPGTATATDGTLLAAPAAPPFFTTTDVLMKAANAFAHGTGAPSGDFAQPYMDGNYMQEMKWAVEIVKEQEMERTFLSMQGYTPLSLHTKLKMKQIAWDHERFLLFGRKARTFDANGNPLYTSGGILEYINPANMVNYVTSSTSGATATVNYQDLNRMLDNIFAWGGGDKKTAFMGNTLLTTMQNSFWNKFMFTNEEETKEFNIPVYKIMGAAGELNLVATWGLQQAGWTNQMLILDFTVPAFERNTFSGSILSGGKQVIGDFDMFVEDNIQLPGEMIKKKQYICITGIQRRAQQYHGIAFNFPNIPANYTQWTNP